MRKVEDCDLPTVVKALLDAAPDELGLVKLDESDTLNLYALSGALNEIFSFASICNTVKEDELFYEIVKRFPFAKIYPKQFRKEILYLIDLVARDCSLWFNEIDLNPNTKEVYIRMMYMKYRIDQFVELYEED